MILVKDVHKRYKTNLGHSDWILKGINLVIPDKRSVGIVGCNGAGKSTLLRIIGGSDYPTRGIVERDCRVSWPMGNGGIEATLTGRQNAKTICRLYGFEDDMTERLRRIEEFAELGKSFNDPVYTYSSGMRSKLQFALSLAFDFDVYISDEVTSAGDARFRQKAADAFKNLADKASIIMTSHSDSTLQQFCESGILIHDGKAYWFEQIDDALEAYKDTLNL